MADSLKSSSSGYWRSTRRGFQNAFIESFNGRLRDELLNETLFPSLSQVRVTMASWRADYNLNRPHSRFGWLTPVEYANTFNPRRDLALRSTQVGC